MPEKIDLAEMNAMLQELYEATGAPYFFDAPFAGVAAADDPFFRKFKTIIGEHHWLPSEALHSANPQATAKSVFVWILPVNERVRNTNRLEHGRPSKVWAAMRSFGEQCNENIRRHMVRLLEQAGYAAIAPHLEQVKQGLDIFGSGFSSHWSERHVAFTAGLGTFGLSAGLITKRGIAMRIGSIVTDLELPPSVRSYGDDPFAWCTRCGACARRCPAHAIGPRQEDRDKKGCCEYILQHVVPGREKTYGWMDLSLGCGLCQANVPCEFSRPDAK